ncbi:MAG: hypothetical protein F6K62_11105 [Sphaerospermopsis sp. SIO1G2]|nr:hypothetical protein [Sphaerospermopsis sp. SIO1G2]
MALLWQHTASARPLVAEISSHDITIHSAFDGTELTLFGVRNAPGDIVVVIRGPARDATIRKKRRIAGIWVNRDTEHFPHIPAFYAMAASRPYEDIPKSIYFDALQVGYIEAIQPFRLKDSDILSEDDRAVREIFAHALLRELRLQQLYQSDVGQITFVGGGLFRTHITFPDNTPTGTYSAEVYLFSDGEVMGMHTTPIYVYKSGTDAFIYSLAHDNPIIYGIVAIILAIIGGLLAVRLFRRV